MLFHVFGPPPHILPVILSSALAFAAGAYAVARHGVPAAVARFSTKLKHRVRSFRKAACAGLDGADMMFSRARTDRCATGNTAFDDYRAATLEQLEQEGAEFRNYLAGLRQAKDRVAFDAFMSDKRAKPAA